MNAPSANLSIELLNHASVIIRSGEVALLTDPWYEGTAFRGGWGLRYDNPAAEDRAAACTHLWVSHFHTDHLHLPTLRKIASRNPAIHVLANDSANFKMITPLKKAGFKNIRLFSERREVSLAEGVTVTRFPTTGIDNMLCFRAAGKTILNFNDCNLPPGGIRALLRKTGPVDILLANFNHAYKLTHPLPDGEIKEAFRQRFLRLLRIVDPGHVIPFASMHYYKAPASFGQNASLLAAEDLASLDSRVLPLGMGDLAVFDPDAGTSVARKDPAVSEATFEKKRYKETVTQEALVRASLHFSKELRRVYLGVLFWIPPISIFVTDLQRAFIFYPSRGLVATGKTDPGGCHIAMVSEALRDWMGKPYGTDSFFVGADFEILSSSGKALDRLILAGAFMENGLAPGQTLRLLLTVKGWKFFWNRREEILSLLNFRSWRAGNRI